MAPTAWPDLSDLSTPGTAEARAALFRLHVELFVGAPARDGETLASFEAIALGYLPRVDDETRVAVAGLLASCPDTPASVLAFLVARSRETRRIVAAGAPALPREAVDHLLADPESQVALARRPDLDPAAVARLIALYDPAVDAALAGNPALDPLDAAFATLLQRARGDAALARALLARGDLTIMDEAALYLAAGPDRQAGIRERVAATALYQRSLPFRASAAARLRLLVAAGRGDVAALEAELAAGLGLPAEPAWRSLQAGRHELIALALRALGLDEEDAVRILLTIHPVIAHSGERVFALVRSMRAIARPIALALLEAVLDAPARQDRAGRHEPVSAPSAARPPQRQAAPASMPERDRQAG